MPTTIAKLQDKSLAITSNGEYTITPDTGYTAIHKLDLSVDAKEKGYTEWPADAPTDTQIKAKATQLIEDYNLGLTQNKLGAWIYVIFKSGQHDTIRFQLFNEPELEYSFAVYYSDESALSRVTISSVSEVFNLEVNRNWTDSSEYHYVLIFAPDNYHQMYSYSSYNGLTENGNCFFARQERDSSYTYWYFTQEDGGVYCPTDLLSELDAYQLGNIFPNINGDPKYKGLAVPSLLPKLPVRNGNIGISNFYGVRRISLIDSTQAVNLPTSYIDEVDFPVYIAQSKPGQQVSLKKYKSFEILPSTTSISSAFSSNYCIKELPPLPSFTNVTNFSQAFYNCYYLKSINLQDTNNGTNFYNTFYNCFSLERITGLNTSSATNMSYTFYSCSSLTSIPSLDLSHVTTIDRCFTNCSKLQFPSETFYLPVATNCSSFLQSCYTLKNVSITAPESTNISQIVYSCSNLETLTVSAPKTTDCNYAFAYSGRNTTGYSIQLNIGNPKYFQYTFQYCESCISISALDTSNVLSSTYLTSMFDHCTSLTTLGTNQVTDKDGNLINPWIFKYSVSLEYSPLNLASIKHVMQNLGSESLSKTFKLSGTSKGYLEAEPATDGTSANLWEQLSAEAVAKHWTVSVNTSY